MIKSLWIKRKLFDIQKSTIKTVHIALLSANKWSKNHLPIVRKDKWIGKMPFFIQSNPKMPPGNPSICALCHSNIPLHCNGVFSLKENIKFLILQSVRRHWISMLLKHTYNVIRKTCITKFPASCNAYKKETLELNMYHHN